MIGPNYTRGGFQDPRLNRGGPGNPGTINNMPARPSFDRGYYAQRFAAAGYPDSFASGPGAGGFRAGPNGERLGWRTPGKLPPSDLPPRQVPQGGGSQPGGYDMGDIRRRLAEAIRQGGIAEQAPTYDGGDNSYAAAMRNLMEMYRNRGGVQAGPYKDPSMEGYKGPDSVSPAPVTNGGWNPDWDGSLPGSPWGVPGPRYMVGDAGNRFGAIRRYTP